jgi:hypothetical protein
LLLTFLCAFAPLQASALTIYLPENATYRYFNASGTVQQIPANWFLPGFDDSAWSSAPAPFANVASGAIVNSGNSTAPYAPDPQPTFTPSLIWAANYDPLVRTTFTLAAPTDLTLWLAVDNGVGPFPAQAGVPGMFLNGVGATASVNAEGVASRWEHIFDVPAVYTLAGTNTLAIQLEDHGILTGFALVITADDPTVRPIFSTNPPPVPEPAPILLVGAALSLLMMATLKRKRRIARSTLDELRAPAQAARPRRARSSFFWILPIELRGKSGTR